MSIFNHFQHLELTNGQQQALAELQAFLGSQEEVFLLKGYAGSGKTTLLKGLVQYLHSSEKKFQLMAPTGRAAKVIHQKTGFGATTVHKGIYSFDDLEEIKSEEKDEASFKYFFKIRNNFEVYNSVLIIDEASMVSDVLSENEFFRFGSGFLLQDLIEYSRIKGNNSTKIIFVGDPAQLPPVKMNFSPALSEKYLIEKYQLATKPVELKEVKRQGAESGILTAATRIRHCMTSGYFNDFDLREKGNSIFNPSFEDFLDTYKSVKEEKIIITYKNKTALDLNETIRKDKYGDHLPLQAGDQIIIGGNNYNLGIMNGEFGVVVNASPQVVKRNVNFKIRGGKTKHITLTWRKVELLFTDENGQQKTVHGQVLENYLYGDNNLEGHEQQALYVDFKNEHEELEPGTKEFKEALAADSYFNAIRLKFGYAVTCHKAQGGEWDNAFVFWDKGTNDNFNFYEQPQSTKAKANEEFYRWAYTAVTRASKNLYCINPPYFTSFSQLAFIDVAIQDALQELTQEPAQPEEIEPNEETLQQMRSFNIEGPTLEDHFLKIRHLARKQYIEVIGWKRMGFEIIYIFKREGTTAAVKTWINGKGDFNGKTAPYPPQTDSQSLFAEVPPLFGLTATLTIKKEGADMALNKAAFSFRLMSKSLS